MKRVIFLDIDGVLNCEMFYRSSQCKEAREAPKSDDKSAYWKSQLCRERIGWLNALCEETDAVVVISSTWRCSGLDYCRKALNENGATFEIIDVTPWLKHESCVRGNEIYKWIDANSVKLFGIPSYDFKDYAIIDDDSDMLLWQQQHFFQTDPYSGLTPNTCYKIKRFFTGQTFDAKST